MRAVNLLPEDVAGAGRSSRVTTTSVGIGGAALAVLVTALLGVLFFSGHNKVSDKHRALASIEQQVASVQAETARKAAAVATAPETGRLTAFDSASSARISWDNLLDDVSRVLPAGSWLSSMNMQATGLDTTSSTSTTTPATTTTTPIPTGFTVSGVAFSQDIVAKVMRRLALIPALSDITLQSSTRADVGTTKAFQFSLTANVNAPEVAR
jgi:Tfp pilus assembly protein PilN